MSEKSHYSLRALVSCLPIYQAASVAKPRRFSSGSRSSTRAKPKFDAICSIFKNPNQTRLSRTISTHLFPSHSTPIQQTSFPSPPTNVASHHDGTGPVKSPVTTGTTVELSTNPFSRSLFVVNPGETEIADAKYPKEDGLDLTPFGTSQLPDHPVLHVLTDRVSKLEEATDTFLTTVADEIQTEVGLLESRLTDLRGNTNNHFTTQDREIESLSEDLVDLTPRVVKFEDGLSQIQVTLDAQSDALTKLGRAHNSILARLDCFATAHGHVTERLTLLESVQASQPPLPFSNLPQILLHNPRFCLSPADLW